MKSPLIFVPSRYTEAEWHLPPILYAGYVGWKLIRRGRVIRESPMQPNLVVNAGLNALGAGSAFAAGMFAQAGTGSNAPANTDTALQAAAGTKVSQGTVTSGYEPVGGAGGAQDYCWRRIIFTFLEANANGNLTEFGAFDGSGGPMWARQLFKDVGGTPTTIIKTSVDQLQVTYEYRSYPPLADVNLVAFAISGDAITSDITVRACGVNSNWNSTIFTGPQTGGANAWEDNSLVARTATKPFAGGFANNIAASSTAFSTYISGNFFVDETSKWDPPVANWPTGIGSFGLYGYTSTIFAYQAALVTKIPKTAVKRTTLIFRRSWNRWP